MQMRDVEFELGSEGPKVVWRPFKPKMTLEKLDAWLQRPLRIQSETARLAKAGIPAPDDMVPSSKQQQIRTRHQTCLAEIADQARGKVGRIAGELTTLGTDVTEAALGNVAAQHAAQLGEIEAGFESRIPPLLKRKIAAEASRAEFEFINKTEDQPTARSAVEFVGSTLLTTTVEAIVNGLLFKEQVGLYSAAGFSFGVGFALALVGTLAGIGWARLKRPQSGRRLAGVAMLAVAGVAAIFVLFVVAHYRDALLHSLPDPAETAGKNLWTDPLKPFREAPQLLFLCVNLAGLWLISAKASTMFGWLDLAHRRKVAERTARRAERCYEQAIAACEAAKAFAIKKLDSLTKRARGNVGTARAQGNKRDELVRDYSRWRDAVSASFVASEQVYRETVQAVHPSGTYQPRFAAPPAPLPQPEVPSDPQIDSAIKAIDARSVEIEKRQGPMVSELIADTDAACKRITARYAEAEAELRGRPHLRAVN